MTDQFVRQTISEFPASSIARVTYVSNAVTPVKQMRGRTLKGAGAGVGVGIAVIVGIANANPDDLAFAAFAPFAIAVLLVCAAIGAIGFFVTGFSQERESYTLVRFQSVEKQPDVEFTAQQERLPAILDAIAKAGIEIRQGY